MLAVFILRNSHTHTHTHIYIYVCVCVCVCEYIYIWMYIYIYMNVYIYIYKVSQNRCIWMYIYIYIYTRYIYIYTRCLKIDATHEYDNDLLLKQAQWRSFGTRPVKNASFELETSNQFLKKITIISASRTCNLFFQFLLSVINHYHINGLHLFWDSFKWFCLQISSDGKYFSSLVLGIKIKD